MRKILVTGGTIFVSRYIAEHYVNFIPEYTVEEEAQVYVMNRGTHRQVKGVHLIECDKNDIGDKLKKYNFDVVIAVNIYTKAEMQQLLDGLSEIKDFVFISSSAVYPETLPQPFTEEMICGENSIWGAYGTNKLEAEKYLQERVPQAYILRPPYLYGEMNNLYRESFIFDCAIAERKFYVPGDGSMKLQFFYVGDLCRFIDIILRVKPEQKIFNVGNKEIDNINTFVKACYRVLGDRPDIVNVYDRIEQRNYFPFYNYGYELDVTKMLELMYDPTPLEKGLKQSYAWYSKNQNAVNKKPYFDYIDRFMAKS